MPTYEYRCNKCGNEFSKEMKMSEHEKRPRPPCPKCSSKKVEQVPSLFIDRRTVLLPHEH